MLLKTDLEINCCIGYGGFSDVYECVYDNKDFAYKKYASSDTVELINKKMHKLEKYSDNKIMFPVDFVYKKTSDKLFEGIIFDYDYTYSNMDYYDSIYYPEKLLLLYSVRDVIEYYHKEYIMIHADINPGNILYNKDTNKCKLIDLDTSIDMKNKSGYICKIFNYLSNNYIKYFGVDYDLDLYLFNLLTISFLNRIEFYEIDKKIRNEKAPYFESEYANKIVDSYKNLDYSKTLKKEYIIDYI